VTFLFTNLEGSTRLVLDALDETAIDSPA